MKLKKCPKCSSYTFKESCPKCSSKTKDAHYKFVKNLGVLEHAQEFKCQNSWHVKAKDAKT